MFGRDSLFARTYQNNDSYVSVSSFSLRAACGQDSEGSVPNLIIAWEKQKNAKSAHVEFDQNDITENYYKQNDN